MLEKARNKRS